MKRSFLFITIIMMFLTACGPGKSMVIPTEAPSSSPTFLPNPTVIPTAQPDMLYVDPTRELGPISPYVYGSNYGPGGITTMCRNFKLICLWPSANR